MICGSNVVVEVVISYILGSKYSIFDRFACTHTTPPKNVRDRHGSVNFHLYLFISKYNTHLPTFAVLSGLLPDGRNSSDSVCLSVIDRLHDTELISVCERVFGRAIFPKVHNNTTEWTDLGSCPSLPPEIYASIPPDSPKVASRPYRVNPTLAQPVDAMLDQW